MVKEWYVETDVPRVCACIGPQNGQPLCPCMMRNVKIKDGRYVQEIDFGPVEGPTTEELLAKYRAALIDSR